MLLGIFNSFANLCNFIQFMFLIVPVLNSSLFIIFVCPIVKIENVHV